MCLAEFDYSVLQLYVVLGVPGYNLNLVQK